MNMKKQVFEYMSKHPDATTADLMSVFPEAKKKSLWNYSRQWKKNNGIQPTTKRNSMRQKVFSFISENPDATQKDLQKAFPDANKVSISNYHYQWRKAQPNRKKKKSVKTVVFSYLDLNPDATFRELKEKLSGINPSSISAYHSIWKQTQSQVKQAGQPRRLPTRAAAHNKKGKSPSSHKGDQSEGQAQITRELINTLQTTIKTQEIAIEVMREQNALLRSNQPEVLSELEGITGEEWEQLRKVIAVFVKGLKQG